MSGVAGGKAVVLLSGGLDSATVLAIATAEGWDCHALTVSYGQRHEIELSRAAQLASALGAAEHRRLDIDLAAWGGSSLTGDGEVPHPGNRSTTGSDPLRAGNPPATAKNASGSEKNIPSTYVPARNTILLSLALGWAEVLGARSIWLGVSAIDYSGYPDCRPEFISAYQSMADLATRVALAGEGPVIRAPLINKSKAETIRWGLALGLDYGLTWSCYDPAAGNRPCGLCDSCLLRARGFAEAGRNDPLLTNGENQNEG